VGAFFGFLVVTSNAALFIMVLGELGGQRAVVCCIPGEQFGRYGGAGGYGILVRSGMAVLSLLPRRYVPLRHFALLYGRALPPRKPLARRRSALFFFFCRRAGSGLMRVSFFSRHGNGQQRRTPIGRLAFYGGANGHSLSVPSLTADFVAAC